MVLPERLVRARLQTCVVAVSTFLSGCAGGALDIDPGQLEARDLLGLDPVLAARWDARERAAARRVLDDALARPAADDDPIVVPVASARRLELGRALDRADDGPAARGEPARLLWRIADGRAEPISAGGLPPAPTDGAARGALRPEGWELGRAAGWEPLVARRPDALVLLAQRAGREPSLRPLVVEPVPELRFAAAYVAGSDRLLVNPVLLAALELDATPPADGEARVEVLAPGTPDAPDAPATQARAGGNPYNFYGSLGECAAAEQARCQGCLPSSCEITTLDAPDGNTECTTLAEGGGRNYFLLCASTALAIATVADCVADKAAGCPRNESAGRRLGQLTTNAAFVDDATCGQALDSCLGDLFGEPDGEFPGPQADGGPTPPPPPGARDVDVSCTSCENDSSCNFAPSCDCNSSCEDTESSNDSSGCDSDSSCDVGCTSEESSGNNESGCDNGGCDSCSSEDEGMQTSQDSSCGGCDSCGSDDDGMDGSSSSEGSSCGDCGSCGSSSDDSSSSSSSCNNCQVARGRSGPRRQALLATLWGLLPLVILAAWRGRGGGR